MTLNVEELALQQAGPPGDRVDEEGLLQAYSYGARPIRRRAGGREAKLSVTVEIGETGVGDAVEFPAESAVQPYLDYTDVKQM